MKKLIAILSITIFTGLSASAQTPQTTNSTATQQNKTTHVKKANKMKQLNLTSDQQQKIKKINKDAKANRTAVMNDKSLSDSQKQDKLKSLKKQNAASRKNVLTADQRAKLKAMKTQKKTKTASPTVPQ